MSDLDPYKANRQFERAYFQGVPESPFSMYEQNSYAFHHIRYTGVPEQEVFDNELNGELEGDIIGTIRLDYKNELIFEE